MSTPATDQQIAAALAEQVYRRGGADQPLTDADIGVTNSINLGDTLPGGLSRNPTDPDYYYYYDDATGFVGRVVEANGKIFVVFRGTDGDLLGRDMLGTNLPLESGATEATQLGDGLALYAAASKAAAAARENLVITGHSLGGGLAGLVTAIATGDSSSDGEGRVDPSGHASANSPAPRSRS